MRVVLLLAVASIVAFVASGAGAATPPSIQFGLAGGNIAGPTVSIKPTGGVTITGPRGVTHRKIPAKRVRRLRREIRDANLARNRICAGALPDIASRYIRLGSHTFRLRGTCEPRFQHVWTDLQQAVGRMPR